jgi:hypothetical protein
MTEQKLLLHSNRVRQLSYQSGYSRIELKMLSRMVLIQYYGCSSIPCINAFSHIRQVFTGGASGGEEPVDELQMPPDTSLIPSQHEEVICNVTPPACHSLF